MYCQVVNYMDDLMRRVSTQPWFDILNRSVVDVESAILLGRNVNGVLGMINSAESVLRTTPLFYVASWDAFFVEESIAKIHLLIQHKANIHATVSGKRASDLCQCEAIKDVLLKYEAAQGLE